MVLDQFNNSLMGFIGNSPTPFHAVRQMRSLLDSHGFKQLHEYDQWKMNSGRYYVTRNNSSVIAFDLPEGFDEEMEGAFSYSAIVEETEVSREFVIKRLTDAGFRHSQDLQDWMMDHDPG